MKTLAFLIVLLFILPVFTDKCIASKGKYWEEDKTD